MATQAPEFGRHHDDRAQDVDPLDVLAAFDDSTCREILAVVGEEALTAQELAEECELPLSTVYRKLDLLTEASLVAERIRPDDDGHHPREFVRSVVTVEMTAGEDGIEMELSRRGDDREHRRS